MSEMSMPMATSQVVELNYHTTYEELDDAGRKRVNKKIEELRKMNPREYIFFGMEVQKKVTKYASEMIAQISSVGDLGDINGIMDEVRDVSKKLVDRSEAGQKSIFRTLFKRFFSPEKKTSEEIDKDMFAGKINNLVMAIEEQIGRLMVNNILFDDYIALLIENVNDGCESLIALQRYQREVEEKMTVSSTEQAIATWESTERTNALDSIANRINIFLVSRQEAMQSAVAARIIQSNNITLSNRLQTILIHGIPILQNQILLKVSMLDTQRGLDICDAVSDTINDTMKQNFDRLSELTGRLSESSKSPIDGTSVVEMTKSLISMADEIKGMNQKARQSLEEVEAQIRQSDESLEELYRMVAP